MIKANLEYWNRKLQDMADEAVRERQRRMMERFKPN